MAAEIRRIGSSMKEPPREPPHFLPLEVTLNFLRAAQGESPGWLSMQAVARAAMPRREAQAARG